MYKEGIGNKKSENQKMRCNGMRLRFRVQDMRNGMQQPIVVFDDGERGGAVLGEPVATRVEAAALAKEACETIFPGGLADDGWYYSAAQAQ